MFRRRPETMSSLYTQYMCPKCSLNWKNKTLSENLPLKQCRKIALFLYRFCRNWFRMFSQISKVIKWQENFFVFTLFHLQNYFFPTKILMAICQWNTNKQASKQGGGNRPIAPPLIFWKTCLVVMYNNKLQSISPPETSSTKSYNTFSKILAGCGPANR